MTSAAIARLINELGTDSVDAIYRVGLTRGLAGNTGYQDIQREINTRRLAAHTGLSRRRVAAIRSQIRPAGGFSKRTRYEMTVSYSDTGNVSSYCVQRVQRGQNGRQSTGTTTRRTSTARRSGSTSSSDGELPRPSLDGLLRAAGLTRLRLVALIGDKRARKRTTDTKRFCSHCGNWLPQDAFPKKHRWCSDCKSADDRAHRADSRPVAA